MKKQYYFLAGLPRSGSTLISNILNQNPDFYSGPSSPVIDVMFAAQEYLNNTEQLKAFPNDNFIETHLKDIITQYYQNIDKKVIIDKSRAWPNNVSLIRRYITDNVKIICPVRNIDEILASFIKINIEGISFIDRNLLLDGKHLTDENRCDHLMSDNGVVSNSLGSIYRCFQRKENHYLHFVEYNDLINDPKSTFEKIYEFLELDYYSHNFTKINNEFDIDDSIYGMRGMHYVDYKIRENKTDPKVILPESVIKKCEDLQFWRKPERLFN
jgi:sulfotransferase